MRYIFIGLRYVFRFVGYGSLFTCWLLTQALIFLWWIDLKHFTEPKKFYDNVLNIVENESLLRWTVIFLVVAIICAIFGFGGIAPGAAAIAKILFFIFLILFVLSLIAEGSKEVD